MKNSSIYRKMIAIFGIVIMSANISGCDKKAEKSIVDNTFDPVTAQNKREEGMKAIMTNTVDAFGGFE